MAEGVCPLFAPPGVYLPSCRPFPGLTDRVLAGITVTFHFLIILSPNLVSIGLPPANH